MGRRLLLSALLALVTLLAARPARARNFLDITSVGIYGLSPALVSGANPPRVYFEFGALTKAPDGLAMFSTPVGHATVDLIAFLVELMMNGFKETADSLPFYRALNAADAQGPINFLNFTGALNLVGNDDLVAGPGLHFQFGGLPMYLVIGPAFGAGRTFGKLDLVGFVSAGYGGFQARAESDTRKGWFVGAQLEARSLVYGRWAVGGRYSLYRIDSGDATRTPTTLAAMVSYDMY